jgi:hypothetical protein
LIRRFRNLPLLAALLAPAQAYAYAGAEPIVTPDSQVFPALVLALDAAASSSNPPNVIGTPDGLVGVRLRATRDGERVRVSIDGDGWFESTIYDATLPQRGMTYEILPPLAWNTARFGSASRVTTRFVFEVESEDGGRTQLQRDVDVHPLEHAPYFASDGRSGADLSWIFAAYVDEDHPDVDAILREAKASGLVDRFDGYASGDPERVYRQVYAIWFALQQRGIRYSKVTPASKPGDRVRYQRVRLIERSLADAKSNCVDGSVLIASVLRRIGIEPTLGIQPQPMLLAFDLDPSGSSRAYLETTLLGSGIRGTRAPDDEQSFASFEAAVERGFAQFLANQSKLADPRAGAYLLVPIEAARARGVKPIVRSAGRTAR